MIISTFFETICTISEENALSIEETAARCLELGVTGIDVEDSQVEDPRLQVLLGNGMRIASMPTRRDFLHDPTMEMVEEVIRLAVKHKVPRILLIPGYIAHDEDKSVVQNAIEPLKYLCELAARENIVVGLEDYDHEDVPTCTIEGLHSLLEQVPALSCIFDSGNFIFGDDSPLDAYRLLKPRITAQMHCKDRSLVGGMGKLSRCDGKGRELYPCAVGEGIMPIREILQDLVKSGFDGVLTAELFGSKDCLRDLQTSAAFIKECISH